MKNEKLCFNKSVGFIVIAVVAVGVFAVAAVQLSQKTTSTSTRAAIERCIYKSYKICEDNGNIVCGKCTNGNYMGLWLTTTSKVPTPSIRVSNPRLDISFVAYPNGPTMDLNLKIVDTINNNDVVGEPTISIFADAIPETYTKCSGVQKNEVASFNKQLILPLSHYIFILVTANLNTDGSLSIEFKEPKTNKTIHTEQIKSPQEYGIANYNYNQLSFTVFETSTSPTKVSTICFLK